MSVFCCSIPCSKALNVICISYVVTDTCCNDPTVNFGTDSNYPSPDQGTADDDPLLSTICTGTITIEY